MGDLEFSVGKLDRGRWRPCLVHGRMEAPSGSRTPFSGGFHCSGSGKGMPGGSSGTTPIERLAGDQLAAPWGSASRSRIIIVTALVSIGAWQDIVACSWPCFSSPSCIRARGEWHRFVTHAFIHADGYHLFVNMFVLYMFGPMWNACTRGSPTVRVPYVQWSVSGRHPVQLPW